MYFGAVQICGERIGTTETKEFCDALDAHKIKMLSLRECGISTKNFKKLMDSLAYCQSILHLNLNLCGIQCRNRVDMLAAALNMNKSLTALLLHGNHFGTEGISKIIRPLILHPNLTCLDVGDCDMGDKGLKHICELLPPDGCKPGLQELVLSGNPKISSRTWEKFSVAVSACSTLRSLYIDFNNVGETAGKMLVVCAAGHKSLNVLDMESCNLTECVGRLLLHLLQRYPTTLSHVLLEENDICDETKYAIRIALGESESESSSSDDDCDRLRSGCKRRKKRKGCRRPRVVSTDDEEDNAVCSVRRRSTIDEGPCEELSDQCNSPSKQCRAKSSSGNCGRPSCSPGTPRSSVPRNSYSQSYPRRCTGKGTLVSSKSCPRPSNANSSDACKMSIPRSSNARCSNVCTESNPRLSVCSKDETSELEETLAKFKICLHEASESCEDEMMHEKNNIDVSCDLNTDDKTRFALPSNSLHRVFDDPEMEREYQTLIADSDYSSDDNEADFLQPVVAPSGDKRLSPHGSIFVWTHSDEEDSSSDLDISKKKAQTIFSRRRIA